MGDPRKSRKKYATPDHPWNKERILKEQELLKKYGLRRKNEIWKMNSVLANLLGRAKAVIGGASAQSNLERARLLEKTHSLGLTERDARIEDILNLNLENIMNRRLQTLVARKNMAKTMRQARQFIVHGHVTVGTKKITSPSYLVNTDQENTISFDSVSSFNSAEHPELASREKEKPKEKKKGEKKKGEKSIKKEKSARYTKTKDTKEKK